MQLDAVTLYFCATIVAACCALAMFHGWRVHRNEPAVRYWMIGFVCSALGTLPIALGSFFPIWLARGVGNTVAVASCAFLYAGTALFLERPVRWRLLAAIYVPAFVANLYGAVVTDSLMLRVVSYAVASSATCLLIAAALWRHPPPGQGGVARFLAACWATYAATALLRGAAALHAGQTVTLQTLGPAQAFFFSVLLAIMILTTVGHLLLAGQRLQLRLDALANRDELTGLLNRRAFQARAVEAAGSGKEPSTLMVVDIDHFKTVNDRYGHLVGDLVLRSAAVILQEGLRKADILARAGGEEFWVLAPQMAQGEALGLAERLRRAVEQAAVSIGSETIRITVSIGLASVDAQDQARDLRETLAEADAAMYAAKAGGRNRVSVIGARAAA